MDEFASRHYPVREHMRFQRRMWAAERIGWGVLVCIALLALTGLFGNGWLSRASVANDRVAIDYARFERATRLTTFTFRFAPGAAGERTLHLNRAFQNNFEITSIQPQPVRSEADADGQRTSFTVPAAGGVVTLRAHARGYGLSRIEVRADGASPLAFSVMIYP